MGKIIVFTNLTLDGVMQGPGRREEDTRDGFEKGGWAGHGGAMQSSAANERTSNIGAMLFGRRTYENFYNFWPKQGDNPFTEMLNNMQKYVVSSTLKEPLPWMNSTLLKDEKAVAEAKAEAEKDFMLMGSGVLIQSLAKANLVDLYVLMIHPVVLASGHHLFPEGGFEGALKLVDAKPTDNGVAVLTYQPAEA